MKDLHQQAQNVANILKDKKWPTKKDNQFSVKIEQSIKERDTIGLHIRQLSPPKSKYKGRLVTAHGHRGEDFSGVCDNSTSSKIRIQSNGWSANKKAVAGPQASGYNIARLRLQERAASQVPGKDVKVSNHILDGDEFMRMLQETKSRKEYQTDESTKTRLSNLIHQNYQKRLQQMNR